MFKVNDRVRVNTGIYTGDQGNVSTVLPDFSCLVKVDSEDILQRYVHYELDLVPLTGEMTREDWVVIRLMAFGYLEGTSDKYPEVRRAIELATGKPFGPPKCCAWMRGFCEGFLAQSDALPTTVARELLDALEEVIEDGLKTNTKAWVRKATAAIEKAAGLTE